MQPLHKACPVLIMFAFIAVSGCDGGRTIKERWERSQHENLGFQLKNGQPVFCTNNPEAMAPDWNEPVSADAGSFEPLFKPANKMVKGFHYARDARKVFIGVDKKVYELKDADPKTMAVIDKQGFFARDDKHVYYVGFPIDDVEANSFQTLGRAYGKDARAVYFGPLRVPKADPQSFQVIAEGTFLDELYTSGAGPHRELSFHENRGEVKFSGCWAMDASSCFHGHKWIAAADVRSFRLLNATSAEDNLGRYKEAGMYNSLQYEAKPPAR